MALILQSAVIETLFRDEIFESVSPRFTIYILLRF